MHIKRLEPAENPADLAALLPAYQAAVREAMPGFPEPGPALLQLWSSSGYRRRMTVFAVFADENAEQALGAAFVNVDLARNADLASVDLAVPAEARAQGALEPLFDEVIEHGAREGRKRLATGLSECVDLGDLVQRRGGKHTDTAIRSTLDLHAIDRTRFEQWAAPSAKNASYDLVSWDTCPDEYADSYCAALDAMSDQPLGDFEFEWAKFEIDRLRHAEARTSRFGISRYTVAAVDPRGEVAGFTTVLVCPDTPEFVEITDTGVARQHRGHGLGLRLKAAASLGLLQDRPSTRWIATFNNDGNRWMLDVNRTLGYRAAEKWPGYEFPIAR